MQIHLKNLYSNFIFIHHEAKVDMTLHCKNYYTSWNLCSKLSSIWSILLHDTGKFVPWKVCMIWIAKSVIQYCNDLYHFSVFAYIFNMVWKWYISKPGFWSKETRYISTQIKHHIRYCKKPFHFANVFGIKMSKWILHISLIDKSKCRPYTLFLHLVSEERKSKNTSLSKSSISDTLTNPGGTRYYEMHHVPPKRSPIF